MDKMLLDILETTFFNIIIVGVILSMLYGLWLVILPNSALALSDKINKSFSMRKNTKPLETPISIERWFYRHAKFSGALIMLAAVYLLYLLFSDLNFTQLAKTLPSLSFLTWEWLLQSFQIFFTLISIFVLLLGFLIIVRPSALKPMEAKANKWVSTRQKMQFMSNNVGQADQLLLRFPRHFGAVILIIGAIVLINMDKFHV